MSGQDSAAETFRHFRDREDFGDKHSRISNSWLRKGAHIPENTTSYHQRNSAR